MDLPRDHSPSQKETEWQGEQRSQEFLAPSLQLSLADSPLLPSPYQWGFVKVNIFWWPLPGSGVLPKPALRWHWPLSQCLWDRSSAEFLQQQQDVLTFSFLLKPCVRGCPGSLILAEHWNTSPLLCLSSYLYGSPSPQCLLSLYCCRWKEFIPQGKEMLALAYEPWTRG